MRLHKVDGTHAVVGLTNDELGILGNALNEVCHRLDIDEFSTRMGAEKREVLKLLHEVSEVFHKLPKPR